MSLLGFFYRPFARGDSASLSPSLSSFAKHKEKKTAKVPKKKTVGLRSKRYSGTIGTDFSTEDFSIDDSEKSDDALHNNSRDAKGGTANEKKDEKPNHFDGSSRISSSNSSNSISSISSHEKDRGCQDLKDTNIPRPVSKRRTMSQRKFEAVTASLALKAKNELEEKRHKAYVKALGPLRIGFVDCESINTDDELFDEDLGAFLDNQGRKEVHHYLHHSFPGKKKMNKNWTEKTHQNHTSSQSPHSSENVCLSAVQKLHRQYASFAKNLPVSPKGSIFVRVLEQRLDLPRVLITGPHGTPYANGLFFFDFYTKDYPNSPPKVRFLTTGRGSVRFNPNLYHSGRVCLSFLRTWQGPGWAPGKSTLLQVLLSFQGLVLGTDEPFFNEPGYESYKGTGRYKRESDRYNKVIRKQTLRWAILDPLQKIVLQEERIEARKEFLEKLKVQRQQEKDTRMVGSGNKDEGDDSFSYLNYRSPPNPTIESTKDHAGSKKKMMKKKSKWRSLSNLWPVPPHPPLGPPLANEGLPREDREEIIPLPSDMPPRQTYEYEEFSAVVIRHFVQSADHIEEQLQSWHQLDPKGTQRHVEETRKWLRRLIDLVESRKRLQKETDEAEGDDRVQKDR